MPLWAGDARIGSVEPDFLQRRADAARPASNKRCATASKAGRCNGELTASLASGRRLPCATAGVAHAWRDEQLAVTDADGRTLGTVERAVVRPLGITTFAVHLTAFRPMAGIWVQQRSLTKPNDPGLWDTLVGGMIPASDSMAQALERETWEEAGLRLSQIEQLRHRGRMLTRRPSDESSAGYVVEYLDWYSCVVPEGVAAGQPGWRGRAIQAHAARRRSRA